MSAIPSPAAKIDLSAAPTPTDIAPLLLNAGEAATEHALAELRAKEMVQGYRRHGYLAAAIDPLQLASLWRRAPELHLRRLGLVTNDEHLVTTDCRAIVDRVPIKTLQRALEQAYCGTLALDAEHVRDQARARWLWERFEARLVAGDLLAAHERLRVYEQLVAAETLEHHLGNRYPLQKRFSLEGCEAVVPLLDSILGQVAMRGAREVVLGMAHRGRLNVLVNVLGMRMTQLHSLFEESGHPSLSARDLKYHLGYSSTRHMAHGTVRVQLAHNPSHLESGDPVICGMARARQARAKDRSRTRVVPVILHGDAAFIAQGIVAETLNLSETRGYRVGGTVHVIVNNQVGFTAHDPRDLRSSAYSSDAARMIDAPVIHVNADDPDAAIFAGRLAVDYRTQFGSDIVINFTGYRRLGHNEQDDPMVTQPALQRRIAAHPTVVRLYADRLVQSGQAERDTLDALAAKVRARIDSRGSHTGAAESHSVRPTIARDTLWNVPVHTSLPADYLRELIYKLIRVPRDFTLHSRLREMCAQWQACTRTGNARVDWCLAENLAYASLLAAGWGVRLSGMDVCRGTFHHRHATWHNQMASPGGLATYMPLRNIAADQGRFSVYDSPVSEAAVLGFEYGYSLHADRDLVVWEAQFGDFVNNAQTIVDQYLASGEAKWGYRSGLIAMLPHGYEGGGPEHSCAHLGRFLQLSAENNLRIVTPSDSGQLFHLLRRQALVDERKPLVIFTPKTAFYGDVRSHSPFDSFAEGEFQTVIGDRRSADPRRITRAVLVSGKLYYDLDAERLRSDAASVAVLRIEQLYPFPRQALQDELAKFPALRNVTWAQEEARNHGAWSFVRDELEGALPQGVTLAYAGRPASAPSATCDTTAHAVQQTEIARDALGLPPTSPQL
jgi:2-oxoglutarate dehydrogenase E1 component